MNFSPTAYNRLTTERCIYESMRPILMGLIVGLVVTGSMQPLSSSAQNTSSDNSFSPTQGASTHSFSSPGILPDSPQTQAASCPTTFDHIAIQNWGGGKCFGWSDWQVKLERHAHFDPNGPPPASIAEAQKILKRIADEKGTIVPGVASIDELSRIEPYSSALIIEVEKQQKKQRLTLAPILPRNEDKTNLVTLEKIRDELREKPSTSLDLWLKNNGGHTVVAKQVRKNSFGGWELVVIDPNLDPAIVTLRFDAQGKILNPNEMWLGSDIEFIQLTGRRGEPINKPHRAGR